jgi:hypothetical protein
VLDRSIWLVAGFRSSPSERPHRRAARQPSTSPSTYPKAKRARLFIMTKSRWHLTSRWCRFLRSLFYWPSSGGSCLEIGTLGAELRFETWFVLSRSGVVMDKVERFFVGVTVAGFMGLFATIGWMLSY